ncbi:hypothetical protein [Geomonas subterranea]|uniref:hypothetical protein n=1 Tax=Geomonas subterranea TaxID=2847989 RepID=UPI001CD1B3CF|nr:hypothetical protein [Geomonas fuzhouensis]
MTTEIAQGKEQGKGQKKAKGQGGQPKVNKALQRAELQQKKLDRKLTRAAQPDTAVVSRKALETNAMVALLGQNDYFITQLRNKVGYDPKIEVSKAMNLLQINGAIRNIVAIANAAMQHTLGMTYEPPRGLEVTKVDPAKLNLEKILEGLQTIVTAAEATAPAETAKPAELKKVA